MRNGKRYAAIPKVRMQIGSFTDNLDAINPFFNDIVDLSTHPQADEVDVDWFYDAETGAFSPEGEIHYPEPEPYEPPKITTNDDIMAVLEEHNQADLDRDELQVTILLNQEEIKLAQQTRGEQPNG